MSLLEDKTVLVTGATSGIGLATARRLAGRGCRVIAAARRAERLDELGHELGANLLPLALDVRDQRAVSGALGALPEPFAEIDVLVNNAGLARGGEPVHEARPEDWDEMIDTNIKGALYVLRAVLPGMVARNSGHIVNMGSIAASYAYPGSNIYGGTKAFIRRLSLNLRTDLAGRNIRVTDIEPGAVETEFAMVRYPADRALAQSVYAGYKALAGEDIAEIVEFVISVPAHVNINVVEVMPADQTAAGFSLGGAPA